MSLGRWFTLRRWVAGSRLDPRPRRPIRRADHAPRPGGFRLEWLEDRCLPTTYASTDVPKAVKDYTTVTSTLMVPNHFPITDVNLNLDIDHTATVDLDISLIGPDGTRVHVFDRQGGAGDNLHSTELDDQAPFPLSLGQPPFTGHFQPAEPLAAFNQHDAFGVWTLEVSDRDINDEGFVRGWSLTFGTNLAQTAFNVVEDRATWGQGVQVRYGVTNDGSAAAGPFTAQVVLSHDAAIDDTDPVLQELNFEDLAPQQWLSGATTVTLPGAADTPPPDFPAGGQVWLGIRIVPRDPGTTVAQPGSGVQPVGVIEDTLTLTQVAREVEPNGTPAAAMPIQPNAAISGSIAGQGDVDYYSFTLPEPSRVEARVTATPGSGLIPLLKLFGPDGKLLVQSAGANLVQQLPAGTYALSVSVAKGGSGSTHGGYLLATEAAQVAEEIPDRPVGGGVVDVNGDGHPDLVGHDPATLAGVLLLGNGDGTFQAPRPIGGGIFYLARVADVDGDGRPDLIYSPDLSGRSLVQLGNGDGTFQAPRSTGQSAFAVAAVADVNGDRRPDLLGVVSGPDPGTVIGVVQLGNGDGTFQAPRPTGGGYILAVADLNGDGRPDLVGFGSLSGPGFVQLGNGDGTFQAPRPAGVGIAVVVADVNGDGRPDWIGYVVGADPAHPTGVVELGNGDGTFQAPRPVGGTFLGASAVADVNGDGRPDLLDFINDTGGLVLLGNGDGTFQAPRPVGVDFFGQPAVADVNGDGRPDLIGSGTHLTDVVLLGNGDGTFNRVRSNTAVKARSVPIRVDLDRDGTPDIAVLDGTGNILFRRGLAGTDSRYDPPVVVNPGRPARDLVPVRLPGGWALAAADARGDGVSLYSAGPGGTFIAGREFTAGTLPVRLAAADLNGDGRDDLVVAADLGRTLTVAFQGPDGRFTPGPVLPISREPSEIILTDLDGRDGPDIAVAEQGAGQVRVFYNDPQHSFAESARFRAGFGPYGFDTDPDIADVSALEQTVALVAGPFDAGGRPALVTVNRGSDRVNTLRVTRDGLAGPQPALSFLTGTAQVVNDEPGQAVAADFDRDGRPDLAVLMQDTAEVWVYHGHGDGTFTLLSRVPAGLQPTGLSAADVNGDGNADLLIGNGDGDVLFVLGNGDGTFHPFVRTDQRVPFVATARRDGFVDVVLADQADDQAVSLVHDPSSNAFTPGAFQRQGRDLIGPGAVAEADLDGKYGTDLIFANSGSNNVLVYLRQPDGSFADTPLSFFAGTNPVGLTVNDLNGNGLPDLVVADQGSNDVAILFGSVGSDGQWTFKYGPRLRTGGTGPNAVTVLPDQNGDGIPDLLVTNGQSGTLALLPGIGNQQGVGTGFFRDNAARVFQIADVPIVGTLPLPDSSRVIGLTRDGGLVGFDLAADAAFAVAPGFDRFATALAAFTVGDETFLAAASNDGVSLLGLDGHGNFAERALLTGAQLDDPSALQVLQLGGTFEVYVTNTGVPMPLELTFGPDALGLEVPGVSSVRDTPLALAATLLTTLVNPPEAGDVEQSSQPVFAAGLGGIGIGERLLAGIDGGGDEAEEAMAEQVPDQDAAELERFISGVEEALREFGWLTAEPAQAPPDGEGGAALDTPALLQPPGCPTAVVAAESQPGTLDAGPAPDVAAGSQPGDKGPTAAGPRDTVVGPVCQPARAPSRVRSDRAALPAEAAPDADDLPSAAGPLWWHLSLADLALVFVGTWGAMYVALDLSFSGSSDRGASGSLCHTVLPSPRRR
jgi:subtilisin-like proprotein convertase family protein